MKTIKISDWYVSSAGNQTFHAPECRDIVLVGVADDYHGRINHRIRTSPIATVQGTLVTTFTGSQYQLGTVAEGYQSGLRDNCPDWDPDNPITLKDR